jgi:hypothetical protein
VNVFARELSDNLASLVKKLDAAVEKNQDKQMAGFVVLLTNDPDADESRIKQFQETHGIKNLPLTLFDGEAGPPNYKLAEEADVTVHMWVKGTVKAQCAFRAGELDAAAIKSVVSSADTILE